eukprot:scaffold6291_cov133-Skeletonema_marinoi.AAC.1
MQHRGRDSGSIKRLFVLNDVKTTCPLCYTADGVAGREARNPECHLGCQKIGWGCPTGSLEWEVSNPPPPPLARERCEIEMTLTSFSGEGGRKGVRIPHQPAGMTDRAKTTSELQAEFTHSLLPRGTERA